MDRSHHQFHWADEKGMTTTVITAIIAGLGTLAGVIILLFKQLMKKNVVLEVENQALKKSKEIEKNVKKSIPQIRAAVKRRHNAFERKLRKQIQSIKNKQT